MPDLRANDTGERHPQNNDAGVNLQIAALDFRLKRKERRYKRDPHQQPKRADGQWSNMDEREQSASSVVFE